MSVITGRTKTGRFIICLIVFLISKVNHRFPFPKSSISYSNNLANLMRENLLFEKTKCQNGQIDQLSGQNKVVGVPGRQVISISHGLMKVVYVMGVLLEKVPLVWLIMVIADDITKNLTCQRRGLLVL